MQCSDDHTGPRPLKIQGRTLNAAFSFFWACSVLCLLVLGSMVKADVLPINAAAFAPNVFEMEVGDDALNLRMEVFIGDLDVFEELVPSSWMKSGAEDRPALRQRLERFARETLVIKADGGVLVPELLLIEPRRRVDRRSEADRRRNVAANIVIAEAPADDRVMYVELTYPLPERASVIEVSPPMALDGRVQSTIGFITFHQGVPVTDFWYLSGTEKLVLNWDDPWYSAFDNRTLKRHHNSSALTFLYVDPREVRHETLIRLRDLADWVDLDLPTDNFILATDKARISKVVEEFFLGFEPVTIDDRLVHPVEARTQFLEVTPAGLEAVDEERTLNANTGLIGVILSYPVAHTPDQVAVYWPLFSPRVSQVPATLIDASGPLADILTTERSQLVWRNRMLNAQEPEVVAINSPPARVLTFGLMSLLMSVAMANALLIAARASHVARWLAVSAAVVLGAGAFFWRDGHGVSQKIPFVDITDAPNAELVLSSLLQEIGDAYYEIDNDRRRMDMEKLVSPDQFADVIQEIDRGLAIRVPSGGIAKTDTVSNVNISEFRPSVRDASFSALADWETSASASHWGHDHLRTVHFRALADVVFEDGAWRLSGLTVLEAGEVGGS